MSKIFQKIIAAVLVLGTIFFTSCQKEFTIDNSDIVPADSTVVTQLDSNNISKIIFYDSANGVSNVFHTRTFIYDTLKRLIQITESESNRLGTSYYFYYQGTSSLSTGYLMFDSLALQMGNQPERHYFTRDNQGRLIKDSLIGNPGFFEISKYSYSGNTLVLERADYNSYNIIATTIATLDSNGNIIKYVTNEPAQNIRDSAMFTYDNRRSPYFRLRGTFEILTDHAVYDYETPLFMKNNMKTLYQSDPGLPIINNISYTYNGAGYPIFAHETDEDVYIRYFYKSL